MARLLMRPAHWTSLSREGNVQGNPAAPSQQCEATGKQDATLWWLTSPGSRAILRGVGRSPGECMAAVGGSMLSGGLGQGERLQTLPLTSSLVAEHISGERRSCLLQTI
jgi:hypothetical protein